MLLSTRCVGRGVETAVCSGLVAALEARGLSGVRCFACVVGPFRSVVRYISTIVRGHIELTHKRGVDRAVVYIMYYFFTVAASSTQRVTRPPNGATGSFETTPKYTNTVVVVHS